MTFNWGTGIAIFFILFVTTLIFQVIKTTQYDHSLVVEKYYEEDLKYQDHYDKLKNAQTLSKDVEVQLSGKNKLIQIQFPQEIKSIKGEVLFFRASDRSKDFRIPVRVNESNQMLYTSEEFLKGLWTVKIDWSGDAMAFYKEAKIVF